MKKINKFLSLTAFAILLNFLCIATIFAESVKINGGQDEIYTTGGTGSAVFDKTTNTLTLNGYNGDYILFDDFDEKTINVVLKGKNTIAGTYVQDSYTTGLGFDYSNNYDEITMNITGEEGSSLDINGYYAGIYICDGTLNLNNVNVTIKQEDITNEWAPGIHNYYGDININNSNMKFISSLENYAYAGVYAYEGKVELKNSSIEVNNYQYGVYSDYNAVSLINVTYKSSGTAYADLDVGKDLTIDNVEAEIADGYGAFIYVGDNANLNNLKLKTDKVYNLLKSDTKITVTNSTIDVKDVGLSTDPGIPGGDIISAPEVAFDKVTLNVSGTGDYENFITSDTSIKIDNSSIKLKNGYKGYGSFFSSPDISVNNSTMDMDGLGSLMSGFGIVIKNSSINAKNSSDFGILFMVAMYFELDNSTVNAENVAAGIISATEAIINKSVFNIKGAFTFAGDVDELTIKDSKVNADCIFSEEAPPYPAILASGFVNIDNSDVTLKTEFPVALLVRSSEVSDISNFIKLERATIKETNLLLGQTSGNLGIISGKFYSLFTSNPKDSYELAEFEDLLSITANEVHILADNKIVFDANGGSGEMNNLFGAGKTSLPENGFTAPNGKRFKGWSLTKDGEIITEFDINGNNTLYAIWEDVPKEEVKEEAKEEVIPDTIDKVVTYISLGLGSIAIILGTKKLYNKKNEA